MTPHKQLFRHDPDNGVLGDCYRTAVACLLDLSPDAVPHFYGDPKQTDEQVKGQLQEWLARVHGVTIATVFFNDQLPLGDILAFMAKWNPGLNFMLSGMSPRDTSHVVICRDGKMVHDPHPDSCGIVGSYSGAYCVEFLVPSYLKQAEGERG